MTTLRRSEHESPLGPMIAVRDRDGALCDLDFAELWPHKRRRLERRFPVLALLDCDGDDVDRRLRAYFDGELGALSCVAVNPGGTDFQREVWAALRTITPGTTSTYGALASRLDRPRAPRAVGAANGQNPVALAIPCHRLLGAGGALTGYAGGIARKRWLLEHEGALAPGPNDNETGGRP